MGSPDAHRTAPTGDAVEFAYRKHCRLWVVKLNKAVALMDGRASLVRNVDVLNSTELAEDRCKLGLFELKAYTPDVNSV